jgi:hypothetical protein
MFLKLAECREEILHWRKFNDTSQLRASVQFNAGIRIQSLHATADFTQIHFVQLSYFLYILV